jgi:hypothetical protein
MQTDEYYHQRRANLHRHPRPMGIHQPATEPGEQEASNHIAEDAAPIEGKYEEC